MQGLKESDIRFGKICPYCHKKPERVSSKIVYGKDYGELLMCLDCNAYVGTHKKSGEPLGRLAKSGLREMKRCAHHYFDHLWKSGKINSIYRIYLPKISNRNKAYEWLALQMKIPKKYCHIGMMNEDECIKVVQICKPYYNA